MPDDDDEEEVDVPNWRWCGDLMPIAKVRAHLIAMAVAVDGDGETAETT